MPSGILHSDSNNNACWQREAQHSQEETADITQREYDFTDNPVNVCGTAVDEVPVRCRAGPIGTVSFEICLANLRNEGELCEPVQHRAVVGLMGVTEA